MHRSGRSRTKRRGPGSALIRLLFGPVGAVLLGIGIVLAVGYYSGLVGTPASGKPDPGKVAVPNGDSAKADPPKTEPAKTEPAKTEPAKTEPAKTEPAKTEPAKTEPAKTEPAKTEPAKTEPAPPQVDITAARTRIDRSGGAAQTVLATIYYADGLKNAESLQPVQIRLPLTTSRVRVTAEQVVNAPQDLKLYSGLPAGTQLLSVNLNTETGVATVDLSADAAKVQGTAAVSNIQASFVYSFTEISGVKAVQLWVLWRPAVLHGIEWSRPMSRADLEGRNLFKVEPVIKYGP